MHSSPGSRITLSSSEGYHFIDPGLILHCEADGNYTTIYFSDHSRLFLCIQLGQLEDLLPGSQFIRVHHSHLVNVEHLVRFCRDHGGCLVLSDGTMVPVSKRRRGEVLGRLR